MNREPVWARQHAERDGLEIETCTQPAVKVARVHTRVPLVTSVTVRTVCDYPQGGATISVLQDGQGLELAELSSRTHEGELKPGEELSWSDFGAILPAHDHLAGLNESHSATLRVVASRTRGDDAQGTRTSSLEHHAVRRSRSCEMGSGASEPRAVDWISWHASWYGSSPMRPQRLLGALDMNGRTPSALCAGARS